MPDTPIYEAAEQGVPKGGVIVVQEAFGVNDHIKDIAQRFAAEGYRAIAPHFFHRSGDPVISYEDFDTAKQHIGQLTEEGIAEDSMPPIGTFTPTASRTTASRSSGSAWAGPSRSSRPPATSSAPR